MQTTPSNRLSPTWRVISIVAITLICNLLLFFLMPGDTIGARINRAMAERLSNALFVETLELGFVSAFLVFRAVGFRGSFWSAWRYIASGIFFVSVADVALLIAWFLFPTFNGGLISAAFSVIFMPLFIMSGHKLLLMAGKKNGLLTFGIYAGCVVASVLSVYGIAVAYPPAEGLQSVIPQTASIGLVIGSVVQLFRARNVFTGRMRRVHIQSATAFALIVPGLMQEVLLSFVGHASEFAYNWNIRWQISQPIWLLAYVFLVYSSARIRFDFAEIYKLSLAPSSYTNPYAQIIDLTVRKFEQLIGKEISMQRLTHISALQITDAGGIRIPSEVEDSILIEAYQETMNIYRDLLGDVADDFAADATRSVRAQHPEIAFQKINN